MISLSWRRCSVAHTKRTSLVVGGSVVVVMVYRMVVETVPWLVM